VAPGLLLIWPSLDLKRPPVVWWHEAATADLISGPQQLHRLLRDERRPPTGLVGVVLISFNEPACKIDPCWSHEDIRHYLSVLPGIL
jgi:hypothetical protein